MVKNHQSRLLLVRHGIPLQQPQSSTALVLKVLPIDRARRSRQRVLNSGDLLQQPGAFTIEPLLAPARAEPRWTTAGCRPLATAGAVRRHTACLCSRLNARPKIGEHGGRLRTLAPAVAEHSE